MRLQVAPQADRDLDEIWIYLAKESGSPDLATCIVTKLTDAFFLLVRFPHLGRSRAFDLRGNHRSFAIQNYVIFYGSSLGRSKFFVYSTEAAMPGPFSL